MSPFDNILFVTCLVALISVYIVKIRASKEAHPYLIRTSSAKLYVAIVQNRAVNAFLRNTKRAVHAETMREIIAPADMDIAQLASNGPEACSFSEPMDNAKITISELVPISDWGEEAICPQEETKEGECE